LSRTWLLQIRKTLRGGTTSSRLGTRKPRAAQTARPFRPSLEALDERVLLSASAPAAVTYNNQLHVFQAGSNGDVYDHYWNGQWNWQQLPSTQMPRVSVYGRTPAPVVFGGNLHVFITAADGNLYDYSWNGQGNPSSGHWTDRSCDPGWGAGFSGTPAAIVWGNNLHVFVTGGDGHLHDDISSGDMWQWHDNGNGGAAVTGNPATIGYNNVLHSYVTASDGNLYDNKMGSDSIWHFDNHHNGGASVDGRTPSAITYNGNLHVYVTAWDGNVYDHWWDGGNWHFDNHHNGGATVSGTPGTIVFDGRLHVYLTGDDGNLYDHYWDGANWHFDNHGNASGVGFSGVNDNTVESAPAVIAYEGRLHVFVAVNVYLKAWFNFGPGTFSNDLYDHWYDGSWHWDDHGSV
jgi:hypothetical protein